MESNYRKVIIKNQGESLLRGAYYHPFGREIPWIRDISRRV